MVLLKFILDINDQLYRSVQKLHEAVRKAQKRTSSAKIQLFRIPDEKLSKYPISCLETPFL